MSARVSAISPDGLVGYGGGKNRYERAEMAAGDDRAGA